MLSRLFPFKRGLCHAYWAPNFWAIYNIADKAASIATNKASNASSNTGGLVQEYDYQVLPVIQPHTTFIITIAAMIPCILRIAFGPYNRWVMIEFVISFSFNILSKLNIYWKNEYLQINEKVWLYTWYRDLWLYVIFIWMACSWKGHFDDGHSIKVCVYSHIKPTPISKQFELTYLWLLSASSWQPTILRLNTRGSCRLFRTFRCFHCFLSQI